MDDAKYVFYQEIRDKKRIGRGARHMVGKRGAKGVRGVRFGSDYMSRKERREYTKSGEVRRYNYLNITYQEFYDSDLDTQRDIFYRLCREKKDVEIERLWGIKNHHVKRIRSLLGVVRNRKGEVIHTGPEYAKGIGKLPHPSVVVPMGGEVTKVDAGAEQPKGEEVAFEGFGVNLAKRNVGGPELVARLIRLATLFEDNDEDKVYDVVISIQERDG